MQILITGGTGFIGRELLKLLATHQLVLLTRDPAKAKQHLAHTDLGNIDYLADLDQLQNLNRFDAVINLAGEPIAAKRWSAGQKKRICLSRWELTEKLVELIKASSKPPAVFISGSAIGYYGDQPDVFDESLVVEQSGEFAHHVCAQWESIALQAQSSSTRVCLLRTGVVLAPQGGALQKMLPPYRAGLGGPFGSGQQYMAWIHMLDMVKAIVFLLETPQAQGAFNLCAPHAVSNREFSQTLAKTLHRPHLLATPKWLLKCLLGESASLLFDSARAKPKRLTELGFLFSYSHLGPALTQLLRHEHQK